MKTNEKTLNRIAHETLGLETLETRDLDELDFTDQAVWNIKEALQQAYEAGRTESSKGSKV